METALSLLIIECTALVSTNKFQLIGSKSITVILATSLEDGCSVTFRAVQLLINFGSYFT